MISHIIDGIHIGTIWDAIHCGEDFDLIICVAEFDNFSTEEQHDLMCQNRFILHAPFMIYGTTETVCDCGDWISPDKACKKCGGYGTIMLSDCRADKKKLTHIAEILRRYTWIYGAPDHKKILVHCAAGVERSPLVVIVYLYEVHGHRLEEAFEFVKQRRPIIENRLNWLR